MEDKFLLSIAEASKIFGIGKNRLREIVRDDYECRYHLNIGRNIKIKRKSFENYLNTTHEI